VHLMSRGDLELNFSGSLSRRHIITVVRVVATGGGRVD
jgi:hypothetical protein